LWIDLFLNKLFSGLPETAAAFLNKEGKPKDELFISDRLHLNSEGYVLWNQLIKKRLITIKEKAIL